MNHKTRQIIYWIATALLCLLMLFSAQMYLRNYEMVTGFYAHLGFPAYLIYPSAILKILGVVAIVSQISPLLKEWAYIGFFFDLVIATVAHHMSGDGIIGFSFYGIIFWLISYGLYQERRVLKFTDK